MSEDAVPRRALFIVNRKSRNGATDLQAISERLESSGFELTQVSPSPDQVEQVIHSHAGGVDMVIVAGGDGTLNAAAPALVETGLTLGVLPLGTANDLARTLKIPANLEQACDVIIAGVRHQIDIGRANGRYFFNAAHVGISVSAMIHLSPELKRRWGVLGYAHSLFKVLQSYRPFHADIECDDRRVRVRTIQVSVGNGRHFGGGMTIAEDASIDDHLFFLYSVQPLELWDLLKLAPALRTGRLAVHHPVAIEQGRKIHITTRRKMAVSADGEIVTRTPVTFDILPAAVNVLVPADYFEHKETADVHQG